MQCLPTTADRGPFADIHVFVDLGVVSDAGVMAYIGMASEIDFLSEFTGQEPGRAESPVTPVSALLGCCVLEQVGQ